MKHKYNSAVIAILFYLIDNDNSNNSEFLEFKELKLINNKKPLSFAQNVNQIIDKAIKNNKNLIFLNNDIIFTKEGEIISKLGIEESRKNWTNPLWNRLA